MKHDSTAVDLEERRRISAARNSRRASPSGSILDQIKHHPQYHEVLDRLINGEGQASVARWVQGELGILRERDFAAVSRAIGRLRERLDGEGARGLSLTAQARPWPKVNEDHYPELHRLQVAAEALERRILMETASELSIGKLYASTHREYSAFSRMCDKILVWKERLGLLPTAEEFRRRENSRPVAGPVGKIIADPESRNRVLGMVHALMDATKDLPNQSKVKPKINRPKRKRHGREEEANRSE